MKSQKVTSREYKVMLRPGKFAGPEKQLLTAAGRFWQDLSHAIAPVVATVSGTLQTIEKRRLIVFLDTKARHLNGGGYILRLRQPAAGGPLEATLKFRHYDRYVAESRRLKRRRANTDTKFEEDIKAPFVSLYSFSVRSAVGKDGAPSDLKGISRLFPDLAKKLGEVEGAHTLAKVNGFTASELVITGGSLRFGASAQQEAECALIVWYDHDGLATKPVAVEFSYRYGDSGGRYGGKASRRAFDVFQLLQKDLKAWVDPKPRTKTSFVYG